MLLDGSGAATVVRSRGYEEFASPSGALAETERAGDARPAEHCPHTPAVSRARHLADPSGRLSRNALAAVLHRRADPFERQVVGFLNFDSATPVSSPLSRPRTQIFAIRSRSPCRMRSPMPRSAPCPPPDGAAPGERGCGAGTDCPQLHQQVVRAARQLVTPMRAACCCLTSRNPDYHSLAGLPQSCWAAPLRSEADQRPRAQRRQLQHIDDYADFDDRLP